MSSEVGAVEEPDPLTQYALKKQMYRSQASACDTAADDPQPVQEENAEQIVERELAEFEAALRPIERFGIRNLEEQREDLLTEELVLAEVSLQVFLVVTLHCVNSFVLVFFVTAISSPWAFEFSGCSYERIQFK